MSFNSINTNTKIDTAIQQNIDTFNKTGKPTGPAQAPSGAPEGLAARKSGGDGMAPRQNIGLKMSDSPSGPPSGLPSGSPKAGGTDPSDLSHLSAKVREDGVKTAGHDGNDAIKDMAEMNAMNMKFQVATGLMAMQKGMVEALSKTVKDAGAKVAQLAG